MSHHHDSNGIPDPFLRRMSLIIGLASRFADVFNDDDAAPAIQDLRNLCRNEFAWTTGDCDDLLKAIATQTREQAPLFEISMDEQIDLPAILAEANQALVDLMLRSEQQSKVLAAQNQQLLAQVTTDAITGLGNRTRFEQYLAQQFKRKDSRPLSLILLDLDGFKSINDTHGHPAGDAALMVIGRALASAAREGDLAARIGGDEFALILPQTDTALAHRIAANICSLVAGTSVPIAEEPLGITVTLVAGHARPGHSIRIPGRADPRCRHQPLHRQIRRPQLRARLSVGGRPQTPGCLNPDLSE